MWSLLTIWITGWGKPGPISVFKSQSAIGLVEQLLLSWFTATHWQNLRRDRHYRLWNDEFRFSQGPCGGSEIRLISDAKGSGIKKKKNIFIKLHRVLHLCDALVWKGRSYTTARACRRDVTPTERGGPRFRLTFLLFKGLNRAWMMDHFHSVRPRRFRKLSEGKVE